MNRSPSIIAWGLGLMLIQILVFNKVNVNGLVNPYIYPMILMMLPFQIPQLWLMLIGFLLGLGMDIFTGTMGMHAASMVLLGFIRPAVFGILNPKNEDLNDLPDIRSQGIGWFSVYVLIMISVHHLAYFLIEIGSFLSFLTVFIKVLLSILFSSITLILINIVFGRNQ